MEHAARAGGQAGQLRVDRRPARGRDAVYGGPALADRRADARRPRARHGGLRAELRRAEHRAGGAAEQVPQPGRQRRRRDRRRHGHEHPTPQPGRGLPGAGRPDRQPRPLDGRAARDRARPRLPDRRNRDGAGGADPRLPHRPEHDHAPGPGPRRRDGEEPPSDRGHRDPLPADPRRDRGEDRRARHRRPDQGHLGDPQRERPEGAGPAGARAQAGRRPRRRAQPALPVLTAPDLVLADLPGAGRWQAADPLLPGDAHGVPPASHHRHPPPHRAPAGQGPQPQAHPRGVAGGAGQHRRGDQDHPLVEVAGRGQGAALPAPGAGGASGAGPRGRWLCRAPGRAGRGRDLRALAGAGRRHPPAHARPARQPRAGEARRGAPRAAHQDRRVPSDPLRRCQHQGPDP